jgi:ABC-type transport system substrate-binding protein
MIHRQTLVVAAWLSGSMMVAGAATAQTLRIGLSGDPDTLDPTQARTYVSYFVLTALCGRLFDISPELEIVPQLATGWELRIVIVAESAPQSRAAVSVTVSSTGWTLAVERLMTLSTPLVAVWYSSASSRSALHSAS